MKRKMIFQNKTSQFSQLAKLDVLSLKEMIKIKGGDGTPNNEIVPPPPPPGKN
jgi:hypothetical protein